MTLRAFVNHCIANDLPAVIDEFGPNERDLSHVVSVEHLEKLYNHEYETLMDRDINVFNIKRNDDNTLFWKIVLRK